MATTTGPAGAIRQFRFDVPKQDLDELRRRIWATRWPDTETVSDRSQGVQLAKIRPCDSDPCASLFRRGSREVQTPA
jgi:hypothetical protein